MSDLLVTAHTPTVGAGRAMRVYSVIRALALSGPVDVAYVRFGAEEPAAALRALPGVRLWPIVPTRGARRLARYGAARVRGVPPALARGVSPELMSCAAELIDERRPSRIIAEGPVVAAALRGLNRSHPIVYMAQNVESSFRHALGGRGLGTHDALARFERGLMLRASEVWMPTARDVGLARRLAPGAVLRHVPNAVDVAAITPLTSLPRPRAAIFVANLAYAPNSRALDFLRQAVLPLVWSSEPEARLLVVGPGSERLGALDPRVQALGFVEDLAAVYARAAAAVVPLLEGGGSPLKFIEALAYALPVIATPVAAQGLELHDRQHYLAAADAPAFAATLTQVLRTGAPDIAAAGRAAAERDHSIEAVARAIAG